MPTWQCPSLENRCELVKEKERPLLYHTFIVMELQMKAQSSTRPVLPRLSAEKEKPIVHIVHSAH